jgi:membrane protease YdiL (CAAX protease family)
VKAVPPLRVFFLLAFVLTWGIGGCALLVGSWFPGAQPLSTSSPLYYLAAYSVSLAGLGLTAHYDGAEGVRRLGHRLVPSRSSLRWYLIIPLAYAAITAIALSAAARRDGSSFALPPTFLAPWGLAAAILNDPGPIGEELGWRGFALPRLLERLPPLAASIRLGLVHAAWHLPLFFIPNMPQTHVSLPWFAVGVVAIAVFDTALYLRSDSNLLLAMLVHVLANVCGGVALDSRALNVFLAAEGAAAALVVAAGGLRAPRSDRPLSSAAG